MESNLSATSISTAVTRPSSLGRAEGSARRSAATPSNPETPGLVIGLWIRLIVFGMLMIGASLAARLDGNASVGEALVGLVAGCLLTVFAWRRTRGALAEASD